MVQRREEKKDITFEFGGPRRALGVGEGEGERD